MFCLSCLKIIEQLTNESTDIEHVSGQSKNIQQLAGRKFASSRIAEHSYGGGYDTIHPDKFLVIDAASLGRLTTRFHCATRAQGLCHCPVEFEGRRGAFKLRFGIVRSTGSIPHHIQHWSGSSQSSSISFNISCHGTQTVSDDVSWFGQDHSFFRLSHVSVDSFVSRIVASGPGRNRCQEPILFSVSQSCASFSAQFSTADSQRDLRGSREL